MSWFFEMECCLATMVSRDQCDEEHEASGVFALLLHEKGNTVLFTIRHPLIQRAFAFTYNASILVATKSQ